MNIKKISTTILCALTLCGGIALESKKAEAGTPFQFSCVQGANGGFVTIVSKGNVTRSLITWNSQVFSDMGFTPEVRCQTVTARFNSAVASGTRLRLSTGNINGLGVICALQGRERQCDSGNTIVTLNPGTNPSAALSQMISATAGGRPLALSGDVTVEDWADAALNSPE